MRPCLCRRGRFAPAPIPSASPPDNGGYYYDGYWPQFYNASSNTPADVLGRLAAYHAAEGISVATYQLDPVSWRRVVPGESCRRTLALSLLAVVDGRLRRRAAVVLGVELDGLPGLFPRRPRSHGPPADALLEHLGGGGRQRDGGVRLGAGGGLCARLLRARRPRAELRVPQVCGGSGCGVSGGVDAAAPRAPHSLIFGLGRSWGMNAFEMDFSNWMQVRGHSRCPCRCPVHASAP